MPTRKWMRYCAPWSSTRSGGYPSSTTIVWSASSARPTSLATSARTSWRTSWSVSTRHGESFQIAPGRPYGGPGVIVSAVEPSTRVAFVLGGGGVLGAHEVGMLMALSEAGINSDLIVGTSVGALPGAVLAGAPVGR